MATTVTLEEQLVRCCNKLPTLVTVDTKVAVDVRVMNNPCVVVDVSSLATSRKASLLDPKEEVQYITT